MTDPMTAEEMAERLKHGADALPNVAEGRYYDRLLRAAASMLQSLAKERDEATQLWESRIDVTREKNVEIVHLRNEVEWLRQDVMQYQTAHVLEMQRADRAEKERNEMNLDALEELAKLAKEHLADGVVRCDPDTILRLVAIALAAAVVDARGGAWGDHTPRCARSIAYEHGHQEGSFAATGHWVYDVTVLCDCGTDALKTALATLTEPRSPRDPVARPISPPSVSGSPRRCEPVVLGGPSRSCGCRPSASRALKA